jgi:hypothetical protein
VRTKDAPFADAFDLLKRSQVTEVAYQSVLDLLAHASVPAQSKEKAKPQFVFDQTALRIRGIQADSIGHRIHVVLEFGNRASWAHNLVTRITGAVAANLVDLTVVVVPTDAFSRRIDTNLATFERVVANVRLLERWNPCSIPGPLIVVGVEPDVLPS